MQLGPLRFERSRLGKTAGNFIAESLGLGFLNSIETPVDWRDSALAQAKRVPAGKLDQLEARALPGELDNVSDQGRALREWFRGFVHKQMGRPLTPKALHELGPLNRLSFGT